ncbi:amidase family protein [Spirillospora sp. CA-108201]
MVARAMAAGAVPVGLTASPEFGRASFTASALHGVTRNPHAPELTPGGSSGGSAAAVAAGMVPLGTGTDGAGSLRIPASYCGLVGFKGTYGRVPRGPRHRGTAENDHYGVLTRTVRDTARFLDDAARALDADALVDAHEARARLVAALAEGFARFDLLLTPATRAPAFPAEGPMPTEIAGRPVDHWGALAVTSPSTSQATRRSPSPRAAQAAPHRPPDGRPQTRRPAHPVSRRNLRTPDVLIAFFFSFGP